ncbi:uncharacterized protein PG998_011760 [Apiospora kogelbergensis]|uniref:uncharacterized protein n=1 Tax=Apiospora kogelbergensis TaxID=1337665 RepID=UPI00312E5331
MEKRTPKQADPIGKNIRLDEAVLEKLPKGCTVLSVTPSGQSLWVGTVKIEVRLDNGSIASFFKKGASGSTGARMMNGTFEAEQALYNFLPEQSPRPVGWGTYKGDPDTHFYMCDFVEIMGKSPTGQFGFHATTHLANVLVNNTWNSSWQAFWAQQMESLFDQDELLHDPDDEVTRLKEVFLTQVIPRFLGPLESDGRSIKPCLIHSDLWPGNIKPAIATDELIMFDSCAYWGHNEADLGICRNPKYKLDPAAIREYFQHVPMSEPTADFDGRNHVYAMKYYALLSIMYFKDKRFRTIFVDEMKSLHDLGFGGGAEELVQQGQRGKLEAVGGSGEDNFECLDALFTC